MTEETKTNTQQEKMEKAAAEKLLGKTRRPWYVRLVPLAVVVALAAGGGWWWLENGNNAPKANYVTQNASRGDLHVTVAADGTLNPVRTVTLGSELSGIVRKVNVDVNDTVHSGDVLIELDTKSLESKVASARATLASAKAKLAQNQATQREAEAKLKRLKELNKLSEGKMPSRTELEAQEATVAGARATVDGAYASIADAEAALSLAENDLSKALIRSPIDGVVLARSVEPGYAVAASLQAVELLTLATDLSELELQVSVDEADIGSVKDGQDAYFTVSAYPDRKFPAKLRKVAYGSTTTEKVVTYTTYLDVQNASLELRPGMTASATISTAERLGALLVPNSALRFVPGTKEAASTSSVVGFMPGPPPGQGSQRKAKETTAAVSGRERTVYVLRNGNPEPVRVKTGLTDGAKTEILSGELTEGDAVIVDQKRAGSR